MGEYGTGSSEKVPPQTISGFCIKNFNVEKYVSTMKDKLLRVASMFDNHPDVVNACKSATFLTSQHIRQTLISDQAEYPGGVLCC